MRLFLLNTANNQSLACPPDAKAGDVLVIIGQTKNISGWTSLGKDPDGNNVQVRLVGKNDGGYVWNLK